MIITLFIDMPLSVRLAVFLFVILSLPRAVAKLDRVDTIRALDPRSVTGEEQVELVGRVTYADPIWQMVFLEQDDHYLYVNAPATDLVPGDQVRVSGSLTKGLVNVYVIADQIDVLGRSDMPPPQRLDLGKIDLRLHDSEWVETEGTVYHVYEEEHYISCHAWSDGVNFKIHIPRSSKPINSASLVDAKVRVRGNLGVDLDTNGRVVGYGVFVGTKDDLEIRESGPYFDTEPNKIENIEDWWSSRLADGEGFSIVGVVNLVEPSYFTMHDSSAGMQLSSVSTAYLLPGQVVRVLGKSHLIKPGSLVEAEKIEVLDSAPLPNPLNINGASLQRAALHGRIVETQGTFRDIVHVKEGNRLQVTLQSYGHLIRAIVPDALPSDLERLQEAVSVKVRGVCTFPEQASHHVLTIHALDREALTVLTSSDNYTANIAKICAFLLLGILAFQFWKRSIRGMVSLQTDEARTTASQLTSTLDTLPTALAVVGTDGRMLAVNSRFRNIFGSTLEVGIHCREFLEYLASEPENANALLRDRWSYYAEEQTHQEFLSLTLSQRTQSQYEVNVAPVRDRDGKMLGRAWRFLPKTDDSVEDEVTVLPA